MHQNALLFVFLFKQIVKGFVYLVSLPLGEKEFKYFRKVSCIILFVICSAIIAAFVFKVKLVFVPCCAALVLEGVLITAGKAQRVLGGKKKRFF